MSKSSFLKMILIGCLLFILGLMGYAGDSSYAQEDGTATPVPTFSPEEIARGYELYQKNGCTACHGMNGEGMEVGPALAGHTATQITWQLRAPVGIMLVFSPTQINTADLNALIAYITSLEPGEGGHAHDHNANPTPNPDATAIPIVPSLPYARNVVVPHHWLLHEALLAEDYVTAEHELEHILKLTTGVHQVVMTTIQTKMAEGDYAGALADVELMLTDIDTSEFNPFFLYLEMAHAALAVGNDPAQALDYINHALILPNAKMADLEHVVMMLDMNDIEGATEHLGSLLPTDHLDEADHTHDEGEATDHEDTEATETGHEHEATAEGESHEHEATPTPASSHSH